MLIKYDTWRPGHAGTELQLPAALNKDVNLFTITVQWVSDRDACSVFDVKRCFQRYKKIIDLDLKDQDHLIDLDLLHDLDHHFSVILILIFSLIHLFKVILILIFLIILILISVNHILISICHHCYYWKHNFLPQTLVPLLRLELLPNPSWSEDAFNGCSTVGFG